MGVGRIMGRYLPLKTSEGGAVTVKTTSCHVSAIRLTKIMAPQNKPVTLHDLESRGSISASGTSLVCSTPGSNTNWSINVGLWAVLMLVANVMHPPALVMLFANAGLLVFNLDVVRRVGSSSVPTWLFVVIACQVLITLQYGWWAMSAIF